MALFEFRVKKIVFLIHQELGHNVLSKRWKSLHLKKSQLTKQKQHHQEKKKGYEFLKNKKENIRR